MKEAARTHYMTDYAEKPQLGSVEPSFDMQFSLPVGSLAGCRCGLGRTVALLVRARADPLLSLFT